MDSEDFSEEYLRGFNDGYSEAEEDLIANNFSTELHKEELDLNYAKGRQEGMRFCIGALGDLLNNYSCIETDDPVKLESIKNQTIENNLYNTTSTISQNTIDIDMDRDYGQQSF